jgi:hypothetical protein
MEKEELEEIHQGTCGDNAHGHGCRPGAF